MFSPISTNFNTFSTSMLISVEISKYDPTWTPTGRIGTDARDFDSVCQMSSHFCHVFTIFNIFSTLMLIFVEISKSDPARTPLGRPGSSPWLAPHSHRTCKGTPQGDPGNAPERRCAEGERRGRNLEVLMERRGACARIAGASQRSECRA